MTTSPTRPSTGFVDRDGVPIAYQVAGEGEPLLLISGFGYPSTMWFRLLPILSAGHRVIAFDNRGVGQSASPARPWSVQDMANDALAVLDAAEVHSASVLGCSMGGVIAVELARLAPTRVRGLILACTGLHTADRPRLKHAQAMHPDEVRTFQLTSHPGLYGDQANTALIDEDLTRLLQSPLRPDGLHGQALAMRDHVATPADAADISIPVLVVHGDQDRVTPLSWGVELAALIPNAQLHIVHGAGHALATEAAEELGHVADQFLKGLADPHNASRDEVDASVRAGSVVA
jgi:pimeloyl-ACP methyl ester carboxylesterase